MNDLFDFLPVEVTVFFAQDVGDLVIRIVTSLVLFVKSPDLTFQRRQWFSLPTLPPLSGAGRPLRLALRPWRRRGVGRWIGQTVNNHIWQRRVDLTQRIETYQFVWIN